MSLNFPDKVPEDRVKREILWTDWLETGDTVLTEPAPTLVVMNGNAVVSNPAIFIDGPVVSPDGQSVIFWIENGAVNTSYDIACTIHSSGSDEIVTRRVTQKVKAAL